MTAWLPLVVSLGGVAAGVIGGAYLAAVEWGAAALVFPGRRPLGEHEPAPWEPVEARAADGVVLRGAFRGSGGGRTVLLLHGFGEDRTALLGRGELLAARGWNAALLDSRGRGRSGGAAGSFGGREADDLRAWVDALGARVGPGFVAVAWGRSMGAAVALRAAANDPRLRALVLEAPYPDLRGTLAGWLRRARLPGALAGPILRRAGRLAGVPLDRPRPVDLAPRVAAPVLLLLGTDDHVAPPAVARRLVAAFGRPVEVVEVAGARHADVFEVGGPALAERVVRFLEANCQGE